MNDDAFHAVKVDASWEIQKLPDGSHLLIAPPDIEYGLFNIVKAFELAVYRRSKHLPSEQQEQNKGD